MRIPLAIFAINAICSFGATGTKSMVYFAIANLWLAVSYICWRIELNKISHSTEAAK